jgi:hypothetical protein
MSEDLDLSDLDATADVKTGTFKFRLKDGETIALPTKSLSVTQVLMYLKCPAQYEKRYVEGKKEPPGIALVEGSSGHDALEWQNTYQIAHGEPAPLKKVLERYGDALTDRAKAVPSVEWRKAGESRDVVYHRGVALLKKYMGETVKRFTPVAAEQGFEITVRGVPFIGFIDLVEDEALWDYKVCSASTYSKMKRGIEGDLQLSAYAYATGKKRVGLVPMVKDRGEVHVEGSTRTKANLQGFEEVVVRVAKAISAGAFPLCLPEHWWCSARFCGFWKSCRGRFV